MQVFRIPAFPQEKMDPALEEEVVPSCSPAPAPAAGASAGRPAATTPPADPPRPVIVSNATLDPHAGRPAFAEKTVKVRSWLLLQAARRAPGRSGFRSECGSGGTPSRRTLVRNAGDGP